MKPTNSLVKRIEQQKTLIIHQYGAIVELKEDVNKYGGFISFRCVQKSSVEHMVYIHSGFFVFGARGAIIEQNIDFSYEDVAYLSEDEKRAL